MRLPVRGKGDVKLKGSREDEWGGMLGGWEGRGRSMI